MSIFNDGWMVNNNNNSRTLLYEQIEIKVSVLKNYKVRNDYPVPSEVKRFRKLMHQKNVGNWCLEIFPPSTTDGATIFYIYRCFGPSFIVGKY